MATEHKQLPPESEWVNLSQSQLFDLKSDLLNKYYDLLRINASFAPQFLAFANRVDALLELRAQQQLQDQEAARQ